MDDRISAQRDLDAEGVPAIEDQPEGVEDPLEGMVPPRDRPIAATDPGVTVAHERTGDSLAERTQREATDEGPGDDPTGRLVQPDQGVADLDAEGTEIALEMTDDDALSAEEAAVHPTDFP